MRAPTSSKRVAVPHPRNSQGKKGLCRAPVWESVVRLQKTSWEKSGASDEDEKILETMQAMVGVKCTRSRCISVPGPLPGKSPGHQRERGSPIPHPAAVRSPGLWYPSPLPRRSSTAGIPAGQQRVPAISMGVAPSQSQPPAPRVRGRDNESIYAHPMI
jgi:hypothetical protein